MDFNTKAKGNLYDLNNGYYLSKNDPLFWRKLLNRRPENEEAMYHVGLDLEIDAKQHLGKYYTSKLEMHLRSYHKIIKQASDLIQRSFNKGFIPARFDLLRIEREIIITKQKLTSSTNANNSVFANKDIILLSLLVIAIILSVVVTTYIAKYKVFNSNTNTTNYINTHYAYMLPYEVIEQKPTTMLSNGIYQPKILNVKRGIPKEVLINELVGNLKIEYERELKTAIQVLAIDETHKEIGMALWAGGNATIKVYVYPLEDTAFSDEMDQQLWETTTVVRSAVYQFVRKKGYLPKDLKTLNQSFPNNYLTDLPSDPYKLKNDVTTSLTGDGGWLFLQVEVDPKNDLISAIKVMVKPNILYDKDIPFAPLYISINKDNHRLMVVSGDQIIRTYSAALGKDDSTPEGELYISKKIMNPDRIVPASDNVYGTRAMELSNISYAIHGTNTPASIGEDVSKGCIRLNNADMEDLYAITPLNTPVRISRSLVTLKNFNNIVVPSELYNHLDNSNEEDNAKMYNWNG